MIDFYNADCMEEMKKYPDNYFDLAIVDPPYGININNNMGRRKGDKKSNYKKVDWDSSIPDKEYFEELKRISKNQIIWGGNYFIEHLNNTPCVIVWDKDNSGNFADCELAWTSFKTAVRKFEFRWNGMLQGNMKDKEHRIHPTQKPVALYKWLLTNYAKQGDKILDTHVGSGSIMIACHDLGFDFTGYEIDEEYYQMALERLTNHQNQISMFSDMQIKF